MGSHTLLWALVVPVRVVGPVMCVTGLTLDPSCGCVGPYDMPCMWMVLVFPGPFFPGMSLETGLPKPNYFTNKGGRTVVNASAAPLKSTMTKAMAESKTRREREALKEAAKEEPKVNRAKVSQSAPDKAHELSPAGLVVVCDR